MSANPGEHQIVEVPAKNALSCPCLLVWVWNLRSKQSRVKGEKKLSIEVLTINQY